VWSSLRIRRILFGYPISPVTKKNKRKESIRNIAQTKRKRLRRVRNSSSEKIKQNLEEKGEKGGREAATD